MTYDIAYSIKSVKKNSNLSLKYVSRNSNKNLQKDLLNELPSELRDLAAAFLSGELVYKMHSLDALREDKTFLVDLLLVINGYLPLDKINFDEEDLLIPEKTGIRAWFSLDAWRNWFYDKR